ncbi:TetR family transcriptional regulator [Amycolatopsis mediterranei S699]|uniref:TetR family transcriptional regulator n=2 Tax=Amycolatopsis mediterranei TaxID=33910 RepID=A0A0H3DHK0_AMYMU|nr:TetR/AcrR family transcriptional regulator [Amycolatopsis mediterranei]ADJ50171.1 TetR family transcriptional regulator [Amycolatopsis mediterranei U32]AEK47168.1 TetR family transcriptional regulator [Amycolatopsis mediterranei S699]AFO81879.1 TetR family transcriptional regulator [Amycolatopsis mediterranei S699]AGT89008.1 TetR family transcriptional regulator [Amycolatopsis mediterranei RB]KDO07580.1 TetR family transcriptional regulator [Amycolatopsis mediterranei]
MPKILGESLEAHRREVRSRVFDVLRAQLYERGFDAITLAGVASAAGVGRTALYNHFPDKESLLVAFVEDEAAQYVTRLTEAVEAQADPVDQLATFVRLQLRVLAEYHMPPGTALASALAPAAYRRISAHADPITDRLRAILAGGVDLGRWPAEDPDVLIPMITAALGNRTLVDGPAGQLEEVVEAAVRFVLRAVGATV